MDIEILALKFCDYSRYIRGYSPETIKRYKRIIRYYRHFAQIETIEKVSEENLRNLFLYGRTVRDWSPGTFICYHLSLGVFLTWCVVNGYLPKNPIKNIEFPKVEKRIPPKLTKQESLKLLEVVLNYPYDSTFLRYRNHAVFSMCIFAGLRKNELVKLKFVDVDIENLTIFVNQGKGNKDRMIPMSFTLAQSLRRYVDERKKLKKTCPEFFCSLNLNMGFRSIGLRNLVGKIRQASKIKFTLHKLRHTFATLMLEGGCDIYSLSRMMGHSDIKTTTIYLSASTEHLRSQMTKHPLNV